MWNVTHGDSITLGSYLAAPYPDLLSAQISANQPYRVYTENVGVNSIGFVQAIGGQTLVSNAGNSVDSVLRNHAVGPKLVVWGGTNDIWLAGQSASQTYTAFETYIAARISAGWNPDNIVVVTMLPRYDALQSPSANAALEVIRQSYISLVVGGASTYGYRLARVDLNANIGAAGASQNIVYYQPDQVHPNPTGIAIAEGIMYAAEFP